MAVIRIGIFLITIFLFSSCNPNKVFEEHQELSANLIWPKNESKTFQVEIEQESDYQISIALRHVTGFPFKKVSFTLLHSSNEQPQSNTIYTISIADENNEYLGEPALDIWDRSEVIEKNIHLTKGEHIFEISHNMPIDTLTHVMEVGIIVEKGSNR